MNAHFEDSKIEIAGSKYVAISTRNIDRAVRFYSRLFGFTVVDRRRDETAEHVLLGTRGDAFVAVHEHRAAVAPSPGAVKWTFAVPDLERVRATLWNQGVVPVADGVTEQPRSARTDERSIVIRDPDGHEIELVE